MDKTIVVRLVGGIGNQLFTYAAARRLSLVRDMELVIDHISGFQSDYDYKRTYQLHHFSIPCRLATPNERFEPFSLLRRAIKKRVSKFQSFEKRTYITQEKVEFDQRLLDLNPKKSIHLEGYWQSERYFYDVKETIKKELNIQKPKTLPDLNLAGQIKKSHSVAIHLRFFEQTSKDGNKNVTEKYYTKAIEIVKNKLNNPHFFVFSDKPELANQFFKKIESDYTIVSHNNTDNLAWKDLWLMRQCSAFIIANSTFSWWGAWLSDVDSELIIAPQTKKTMWWGFDHLISENWNTIKC